MKPFGQPVTEIFDFEEGSRFAALTVEIYIDIYRHIYIKKRTECPLPNPGFNSISTSKMYLKLWLNFV